MTNSDACGSGAGFIPGCPARGASPLKMDVPIDLEDTPKYNSLYVDYSGQKYEERSLLTFQREFASEKSCKKHLKY